MLEKWLKKDGIITIPRKDSVRKELFEFIVEKNFEKGNLYTEKQVNETLKKYYTDHVFLRRLLISYKVLNRKSDCSLYWR